jgi:DNA-binding response OmpR family regulator
MKRRAARKSGRGGRALLTGLMRCGRCGRMMWVFYGMRSGHAHRYQCRGDDAHVGSGLCIGIGGVRVDRAVAGQILEAVSEPAVEAALLAAEQTEKAADDIRRAIERELEEARYQASLAERRYEHVDPAKRHVARELEARWNAALEHVATLATRLARLGDELAARPRVDREALLHLAHDLPRVWNAAGAEARAKQRIVRLLIEEIMVELDDDAHEVRRGGTVIELSPTEFKLLRYLMLNPNRVLSKAQILDHVWEYDFNGDASIVESYISYLRRKVDIDPEAPALIQTKRGVGYVLRTAEKR